MRSKSSSLRSLRARTEREMPGSLATSALTALTASERVVAELAAAGRSNREIAAELVVSVRTVESQPSAAYRKLDVRSRAQLRDGLTATAEARTVQQSSSGAKFRGSTDAGAVCAGLPSGRVYPSAAVLPRRALRPIDQLGLGRSCRPQAPPHHARIRPPSVLAPRARRGDVSLAVRGGRCRRRGGGQRTSELRARPDRRGRGVSATTH